MLVLKKLIAGVTLFMLLFVLNLSISGNKIIELVDYSSQFYFEIDFASCILFIYAYLLLKVNHSADYNKIYF